MEIKIRVLVPFLLFPFFCLSQGILQDTNAVNKLPSTAHHSDYFIVNLHADSLSRFCDFDYHYQKNGISLFLENSPFSTEHPKHPVIRIARNFDLSPFLRYLNQSNKIYILDVLRKLLLIYDKQSHNANIIQLHAKPYCLAIAPNKTMYLGCSNRSYIYKYNRQQLIDSIRTIGNGIRNLLISENSESLFFTVRNAKSICRLSLSNKEIPLIFNQTGNEYIKIFTTEKNAFLYAIQSKPNALAKYSASDLSLLETFQINGQPQLALKEDNRFFIQTDSGGVVLADTIRDASIYEEMRLDSSGRYTWIVGSYTRAKWALNKKRELEEIGITCYLSNTEEGYYRLCAGLFKNQEEAIYLKAKHEEILKGAWLMTIHPHKF